MKNKTKKLLVGGQAVIEGVMMRSPNYVVTTIKTEEGKLKSKKERLRKKSKFFKFFFVRGIVNLIEMMVIGVKSLLWSAEQATEKEEEKLSSFAVFSTILMAAAFTIALFVVLPFYLAKLTRTEGFLFNLIDGIIRVAIFLVYLALISLMKDIRGIFQYHGAEHKAVNCYEADKKLTADNAKKFSTIHIRCGTSFIIIVLVIAVLVFSLIPSQKWYYKLGGRIILLPVIAGLAYEFLRLTARFKDNLFVRMLAKPGLLIQKLTTREPNKKQIEIALISLKNVLKLENKR